MAVAGQGGAISTKRLGTWLAANEGQIVQEDADGESAKSAMKKFQRRGMVGGFMTWQLEHIGSYPASKQITETEF